MSNRSLLRTAMVASLLTMLAPALAATQADEAQDSVNPAIDMTGYLEVAGEAAQLRSDHRLSEAEFAQRIGQPGVVLLDARSAERFAELHIRGAVNLSFTDFNPGSLSEVIPSKDTMVLIYCNNNFDGAEQPFPRKLATASLNLSTYIALHDHGYHNVYELGPLVDIEQSILPFAGSLTASLTN